MENPLWVNDVVAQNSLKVNDVMAHPGKRCPDTYHLSLRPCPLGPSSIPYSP
jgi:hypothetical protein